MHAPMPCPASPHAGKALGRNGNVLYILVQHGNLEVTAGMFFFDVEKRWGKRRQRRAVFENSDMRKDDRCEIVNVLVLRKILRKVRRGADCAGIRRLWSTGIKTFVLWQCFFE